MEVSGARDGGHQEKEANSAVECGARHHEQNGLGDGADES